MIQHHLARLTGRQLFHLLPIANQRDNLALRLLGLISTESGPGIQLDCHTLINTELAGSARSITLCSHCALKAGFINFQPTFARYICGEIHGKTVGVVELEHRLAGNDAIRQRLYRCLQQPHTLRESFSKPLLFLPEHTLDMLALLRQLGICSAHLFFERSHKGMKKRRGLTKLVTMANRSTDDPAQYIAATFIGGQHPISNQE